MRQPEAVVHAREAGFTLVEMVIALALTSLVLVLALQAHRIMAGWSSWGAQSLDRLDMTARGLGALRRDLQRAERATIPDGQRDRFLFEGERRSVSFVVIEPSYPTEAGSYLIRYDIRKFKGGTQLTRSREPLEQLPARSRAQRATSTEEPVVVVEGPYDMTFAYFERGKDRAKWVDKWQQSLLMPEFVRFEARSTASNVPNLPVVLARPRIDAENACLDTAPRLCTPLAFAPGLPPASGSAAGPTAIPR